NAEVAGPRRGARAGFPRFLILNVVHVSARAEQVDLRQPGHVTFDVVEHLDHPGGVRGGDDHTDESTAVEVEVTDFCHRHLEPAADLRNDGAYGGAFGLPGTHCPEEDVELDRRIPHCSSMPES